MLKAVIFDFDLTLFDSSLLKPYMDNRQWALVYRNIPKCSFYPHTVETIKALRKNNIKVAIVSNSPNSYVSKVLQYCGVTVDYSICYHDVNKHKPSPEGVYKILNYFSITADELLYIGDNDIDYNTANNADIRFFGVSWGTFSKNPHKIDYSNFDNWVETKLI